MLLFNTCDSYFRELREGVGSNSKATEPKKTKRGCGLVVSLVQEVYSTLSFFLNGKNFALHVGAKHRCLKLSQISRNVSPEGEVRYTYTENCSKNRAGGFNQLSVPNKVVHQCQD